MPDTDRLQLVALLAEIRDSLGQSDNKREKNDAERISDTELGNFFGIDPAALDAVTKKQIALAKRLSGAKDGQSPPKHVNRSPLVSIMSSLDGVDEAKRGQYVHPPIVLNPKKEESIIPIPAADSSSGWDSTFSGGFITDFRKLIGTGTYTPETYHTVFALLHKYMARIQASPQEPDVSLYDSLRTTAAIAACIARENLSEDDIDKQLSDEPSGQKLCTLLKGDISGIQSFLYQILSDGAARQLRGRSFYLQLLTEAIAHWVLRKLELPIVNLLLASGGHFYILAPYTEAGKKLESLQREISEKLWAFHQSDLSFILAGTPVTAGNFKPEEFSSKWRDVSIAVNDRKRKKWSEMEPDAMFNQLFEPSQHGRNDDTQDDTWKFGDLGTKLRNAEHLIVFEVQENIVENQQDWQSTMKAFGWEINLLDPNGNSPRTSGVDRAIVYRLSDTNFLGDNQIATWTSIPTSYDFRLLPQVIAHQKDGTVLDYNNLANASDGVHWFGALRMDIDNLGAIFGSALGNNATLARMATLSETLRLFFEGYVPKLCNDYNQKPREKQKKQILELIYAGGDDLFLVGGWSALPQIAQKIRDEFRCFTTGDHVTLSGGIFIEHQKFPLYQFADRSGEAEYAAKQLKRNAGSQEKNAISFLQTPMSWEDFIKVSEWHQKFVDVLTTKDNPLPRDILTRLSQIYSVEELKGRRWAWRSLYYFYRMRERYRKPNQLKFLNTLERALNQTKVSFELKEFIRVITRWTALRIRKTDSD